MMSQTKTVHPPKVLVTKIGLDGHDRGSRVVAAFLRDAGMDVLYTPPWQEIGQVMRLAEEEDVDVIGISSLATDHLLVPKLMKALKKAGLEHVPVVIGGIVPDEDERKLKKAGVQRRSSIRARRARRSCPRWRSSPTRRAPPRTRRCWRERRHAPAQWTCWQRGRVSWCWRPRRSCWPTGHTVAAGGRHRARCGGDA